MTGPASGTVAAGLDALHASRSGPLGAAMRGLSALNNDPGFRAATLPIAAPVGDVVGRMVERAAPFVTFADPGEGLVAGLARLGGGEAAHLATASLAHDAEGAIASDAERVTTRDVAESCVKCFPTGTAASVTRPSWLSPLRCRDSWDNALWLC